MKGAAAVGRWLASRGGGVEAARDFLRKPIPRNVGWVHTLGSLLLVYILFQSLTGVLLGVYYSASTGSAFQSVRYVREELFLGDLIYKLHKAGAGFVLVTAFVHLARSYFTAAYKAPRELLWLTGLLPFVLLTLLAFTGQLLPFDQHGYWATVVGLEIASSAPLVGGYVRDLLTGGYDGIGEVTLGRFHLLHVSVLPLALLGLLGAHLAILQRVGSAGPTAGSPEPLRSFYPSQALKDVLVAAAGALALLVTAALWSFDAPVPSDPAAGEFVPRPEWYFYAHFELLKLIPGNLQVLGTFVLPNLLLGALMLLPFVDRRPERAMSRRKVATGIGLLACLALVGLTLEGIASAAPPPTASDAALDPAERGRELFVEKECTTCHTVGGQGGDLGPDLDQVGRRLRADYLPEWIRNPRNFRPTTEMPSFEGTEDELNAIVSYLLTLE